MKLQNMLEQVVEEFWKADGDGDHLEVRFFKDAIATQEEMDEYESVNGILENFKEHCIEGKGPDIMMAARGKPPPGYRRMKHGITMDSGSNVDIAPDDGDPDFPIGEPTGPRKGKRLAAANGTPIEITGEKRVKFMTREGHQLEWPFIAGKVRKTLKSVGTTCDAGNYVLYTEWGGYIINSKTHEHIEFDRVSNVYAIDAWVKIKEGEKDFARQATVP